MATFVLIHGAGDVGWYWHLVERELRQRGHDTLAPDLPCDDDSAGLPEYADTVVNAIGGRRGLVVVAQSFGGFTAPLVAARVPVDMLVLVTGMIPAPGEAPDDWSANTGLDEVMGQQQQRYPGADLIYQDVPPALAEQARCNARGQSDTPGHAPWPLNAWPPVATRFVLCTQDRFFPPEFMRRVVADRLGVVPDEIAAGHRRCAEPPETAGKPTRQLLRTRGSLVSDISRNRDGTTGRLVVVSVLRLNFGRRAGQVPAAGIVTGCIPECLPGFG